MHRGNTYTTHTLSCCLSVAILSTQSTYYPLSLRALEVSPAQCVVPFAEVRLLSPVLAPEKVVCVGMNYRDHCLEQNAPIPKEPIIFSKFPSAITGPFDDITLPDESQVRAALVNGCVPLPRRC